jgi:hypothetical protein
LDQGTCAYDRAMGNSLKDYLREGVLEIPNAFRRGVVIVTLLANSILAVAIYAGWHLSAFTAQQTWAAAAALTLLEIALILPFRLWKANRATIEALHQKLKLMGIDRSISFSHANFNTTLDKKKKFCDVAVKLNFNNTGDYMVKWRLLSWSVESQGMKLSAATATSEYFSAKTQSPQYSIPALRNIPFNGWPMIVDVMFHIEYDSVPPVEKRKAKRIMRFSIPTLRTTDIDIQDLIAEES